LSLYFIQDLRKKRFNSYVYLAYFGDEMGFEDFVDFIDSNYPNRWNNTTNGTSINRVLILHVTKGNVHENLRRAMGTYSASKKTQFDLTSPVSMPAASSATWNAGLISSNRARSTLPREPFKEPILAWDASTASYRRTQIQIAFPAGGPSSQGWRSLIGNSRSSDTWSDYVWSQVGDNGFIIFMKSGNNMTLSFGTPYHSELHDLIAEFGVSRNSPGCYFERPLPSITSSSGHVYVLRHPYDDAWLKVGKAKNVKSRLSSYNTGSPIRYDMPHIKPTNNQEDAETAVHNALVGAGIPRNREWFQTDLDTVIRCVDRQIDINWPSSKPSFRLGSADANETKSGLFWAASLGLIALFILLYLI